MTGSSPSSDGPVAVLAGHGSTAERVVGALRRRGVEPVRVSRRAGSTGRVGDLRDVESLVRALEGMARVYLIPPRLEPDEDALIGNALDACRRAGVERVVVHSVLHPYAPDMPHHLRKLRAALRVRHSGLRWTLLEPASYAQNVLARLVRDERGLVLPSGWAADSPGMAVVDLDDVAEVAALVLTRDGDDDATYELAGPERLTLRQMAGVIAAHTGEPVRCKQRPPRSFEHPAAPPQRLADAEAYHAAYGRHGVPGNSRVLEALLGRPAASFADVVAREL